MSKPRDKTRDRVEVLFRLDGGRYLVEVLRDPRWPEAIGKVRCPGGRIEPGETPVAALCRELREEYGFEFEPDDLAFVFEKSGPRGQIFRFETSAPEAWLGQVSTGGYEELIVERCQPDPWG